MPKLMDDVYPPEGLALAINLVDLERVHTVVRERLLGHGLILLHRRPIWIDRSRMDETGLAFDCPLLQAAAICDLIRDHDRKVGDPPTRIYLRRIKAWDKLPGDVVLVEGERLNPKVFRPQRAAAANLAFPTRRVRKL